jgi:hypothetical protein
LQLLFHSEFSIFEKSGKKLYFTGKIWFAETFMVEPSYPAYPNITKQGSERIIEAIEFPKTFTIIGNLAVALLIGLDTAAFLLFNLVASVVFLLAALIAVYGILKFLGCLRPCYNCKKCTFGLGRLAALYFGKRNLKDYTKTYGLPVAIFSYIFLCPFPATVLLVSTFQAFSFLKVGVLLVLLLISIYSGLTWHTADEQQPSG